MASCLAFLQPLSNVSSSSTLLFLRNPHHIPSSSASLKPSNFPKTLPFKSLTASFSLLESDSPKSFQPNGPNFQSFLQELADSFDLPPDYFAQLPNDLWLDLNDAAFDLSNGRILDECGQELGETLLSLSSAWEQADDTSTSHALASKLPGLEDSDFNPKISDFGLAKLCSREDSMISMTAARGSMGYIAPKVFNGNFGSVSHKSDVYSFGMLVLEIVGSRKQPALTSGTSEVYFPEWVYNRLVQGEALDLKLDTDEDTQTAEKLVTLALWCLRPSMKAVVRMLEGGLESLSIPPNPFASTSTQTDEPRNTESS